MAYSVQNRSIDADARGDWWSESRYPRPSLDSTWIRSAAAALVEAVAGAPRKASRALAHVVWAAATWARRQYVRGERQVQVTQGYVMTGTDVGREPAEWATRTFRSLTDATCYPRGWAGLTEAAEAAAWFALDQLRARDLLREPVVRGRLLRWAFDLDLPDRDRGAARCGCPAHPGGDAHPSLAFDRRTGIATCMVSGDVWVLAESASGWSAHAVVAVDGDSSGQTSHSETSNKDISCAPVTSPVAVESAGQPAEYSRGGRCAARPTGTRLTDESGAERTCQPMSVGRVNGKLYPEKKYGRQRHYGMQRSYTASAGPLEHLSWCQRYRAGPAAVARAGDRLAANHYAARPVDPREVVPDTYASLDDHAHRSTREFSVRDGLSVLVPVDFWPVRTRWVGVDIDNLDRVPDAAGLEAAGAAVVDHLRRSATWTGRCALVQTGPRGVQAWVELATDRLDPAGFYADPAVRAVLALLDAAVLGALRAHGAAGGHADPSVHAAGRLMRLPGPRIDKAGRLSVARLAFSTLNRAVVGE